MMLWILIALMTALAALAILVPLARTRPGSGEGEASADEAVYREQLAAIDSELERGLIDPEAAEAARAETARRLLAAHDRSAEASRAMSAGGFRTRIVQMIAILALPAAALGLYLVIGAPDLPDQPLTARMNAPQESQPVEVLVAKVERHLADNPEDGEGWAVLAPVYMSLGRPADSARAHANALRLLGPRPDWLTDMGEAITVASEGMITDRARAAFEQAAAMDPAVVKPRFFLALALGQEGRTDEAVAAWENLLDGADPLAAWVPAAQEQLALLTGSAPQLPPALRGPSAEDVAAAQDMSAGDQQAMITSMVSGLAERLETEGGTVAEWGQLMRAYTVLGQQEAALKAFDQAQTAFAESPDDLAKIKDLAAELGLMGS